MASSLDEIAEQFEREFPPQTIRTEELLQFVGMLHRSGLVITEAAGQGQQFASAATKKNVESCWARSPTSFPALQGRRSRAIPQLHLPVHSLVLHGAGDGHVHR